jgi:hypothetical protein
MKDIVGSGSGSGSDNGSCNGNNKNKNKATIILYFPYGIGCGLAGGKCELYEKMMRDFGKENPQYNIIIVKK